MSMALALVDKTTAHQQQQQQQQHYEWLHVRAAGPVPEWLMSITGRGLHMLPDAACAQSLCVLLALVNFRCFLPTTAHSRCLI
jgi:hypothetical protein